LVQAAYGRGKVFLLSAVYVAGNSLAILGSYDRGVQGSDLVGMVVVIALGRVITSILILLIVGGRVFGHWPRSALAKMVLGLIGPWLLVPIGSWLTGGLGGDAWTALVSIAMASAALMVYWHGLLPMTVRSGISSRVRKARHA
jgi:hypothetical protein